MADYLTPFPRQWRIGYLLGWHLIAGLLLLSWLLPITHELWANADRGVFYLLNSSLEQGVYWQGFWALMNTRLADGVPLLVILGSLVFPIFGFSRKQLHGAFFSFIFLLILMWILRKLFYEISVDMGWSGDSPSLVLEPVFRLSDLVPGIPAKDEAHHSFPGDHGAVLWLWCGYITLCLRSMKVTAISILLVLLFMLPRMVAGAHWLTDNLVGGGIVAIVTLSWAFCTPLLGGVSRLAVCKLTPFIYMLGKRVYGLGRFDFFRESS